MCGIWGYQFPPELDARYDSFTSRAILATMLMVEMDARGTDSFGFACRMKQPTEYAPNGIAVLKALGASSKHVDPQLIASCRQVMAHTRKATHGTVSVANAHPFRVKHIIGAHNGSVSNDRELNHKYRRDCDVDSEHIFHHLADELDLSELRAYGAVTYIDDRSPDSVYMGRSAAGQLEVYGIVPAGSQDKDATVAIVWASTTGALDTALGLAGFTSVAFLIESETLYKVEGGKIAEAGAFPFAVNPWKASEELGFTSRPLLPLHDAAKTGTKEVCWSCSNKTVPLLLSFHPGMKEWLCDACYSQVDCDNGWSC